MSFRPQPEPTPLSSVESAISSLKRARGQTTDAYHEISKAIRELEDAEYNIRKSIREME